MPNIENPQKIPPLADYELIIKTLNQHQQPLDCIIDDCFIDEVEHIQKLKGKPLTQLIGGIINCGAGLFLYVLGGRLAKECHSLGGLEQYTLAASPLMVGGLLRIWAAAQTDEGYGKETILKLLSISLVGVMGQVCFLSVHPNLSTIKANSWEYPLLMLFNVLSGTGIATYSAGMTLGAYAAPNDTPEQWHAHLYQVAKALQIQPEPGFFEQKMAKIIRTNAANYMAIIAGMSNLAPGMALILSVILLPKLGLRNTYLFFASITTLGIIATHFLVHDAVYDQLQRFNPQLEHEKALQIAKHFGQTRFSTEKGFWTMFHELNHEEAKEVFKATFDYSITFGVLTAMTSMGVIILSERGFSPEYASFNIAAVSMISASMRSLMTVSPIAFKPNQLILSSFALMLLLTTLFASLDDKTSSTLCLMLFAFINGMGNFAVVAGISESLPDKLGIATGLSSGIAAFLAFPMSICMAYSEWFAPSLCAFGLGLHLLEESYAKSVKINP